MELLRALVTVAPHRLSGSDGAARAVEWARTAMVQAGLDNVRLDPVQVPRWERGKVARATVLVPAGTELTIRNASDEPAVVQVTTAPPPAPGV